MHLCVFVQFVDTLKSKGVGPEVIHMRLFPLSLGGQSYSMAIIPTVKFYYDME